MYCCTKVALVLYKRKVDKPTNSIFTLVFDVSIKFFNVYKKKYTFSKFLAIFHRFHHIVCIIRYDYGQSKKVHLY